MPRICETIVKLKTPIGIVKIFHSAQGLREIELDRNYNDNSNIVTKCFSNMSVEIVEKDGIITKEIEKTIEWVRHFFNPAANECPQPEIDNEIVMKENFTGLVLRTLMSETSSGTTVSYGDLAKLCGNPKAYRAVGQAMRANPCPLLIPCHRVVASNGGLGHYMSGDGDNIKSWLLEFEKCGRKTDFGCQTAS